MHLKAGLLILPLILSTVHLRADDGAASIPAGGVVVMKREARITMAKEVLQISASKVIVDYDFRNDSNEEVTTEVAFPIPTYRLAVGELIPSQQGFDDFRLWIDGKRASYVTEARAFCKGREYTELLTSLHVDVASFGHVDTNNESPDIKRLTTGQRSQLLQLGLIDSEDDNAMWTVEKKYYWRQKFPAHAVVHIRHEYTPALGSLNSITYGMGPDPDASSAKELSSFCIDGRLHTVLQQIANSTDKDAYYFYVDFILTTANTWKTPIEDFSLIVERPHEREPAANYVSFCWDGPVIKTDADHFSVHSINFVPKKELRIGYFVERKRS